MNQRTRLMSTLASALTCLLLFQATAMAARKVELALPWSKLAPQIHQRIIALILPGGVHLEGKVMDITPEALVLNVRKVRTSRLIQRETPPYPALLCQ